MNKCTTWHRLPGQLNCPLLRNDCNYNWNFWRSLLINQNIKFDAHFLAFLTVIEAEKQVDTAVLDGTDLQLDLTSIVKISKQF
jgi:hypothetical protein